jgi:hypothetical protein
MWLKDDVRGPVDRKQRSPAATIWLTEYTRLAGPFSTYDFEAPGGAHSVGYLARHSSLPAPEDREFRYQGVIPTTETDELLRNVTTSDRC